MVPFYPADSSANAVVILFEQCQRVYRGSSDPDYLFTKKEGQEHAPTFTCQVSVKGLEFTASGTGRSKKEAKNQASINFLAKWAQQNSKSSAPILARPAIIQKLPAGDVPCLPSELKSPRHVSTSPTPPKLSAPPPAALEPPMDTAEDAKALDTRRMMRLLELHDASDRSNTVETVAPVQVSAPVSVSAPVAKKSPPIDSDHYPMYEDAHQPEALSKKSDAREPDRAASRPPLAPILDENSTSRPKVSNPAQATNGSKPQTSNMGPNTKSHTSTRVVSNSSSKFHVSNPVPARNGFKERNSNMEPHTMSYTSARVVCDAFSRIKPILEKLKILLSTQMTSEQSKLMSLTSLLYSVNLALTARYPEPNSDSRTVVMSVECEEIHLFFAVGSGEDINSAEIDVVKKSITTLLGPTLLRLREYSAPQE